MAASKKRTAKKVTTKKVTHKKIVEKAECFTIMQFGGWFDEYYTNIFCIAIENCNLMPRRADDFYRASNIVQDIWGLTKKAKIVIADLTNKNPNVFYELGLAHSLAKPAILVTQSMEDVPFDLRSLRVIVYDKNSPNWGLLLQKSLEASIKETLASPNETIPTAFLEVASNDVKQSKISKHDKEILEMKNEIEFLKRQVTRGLTPRMDMMPDITEDDASFKIRDLIEKGYRFDTIDKVMFERYRVPMEWTKIKLAEILKMKGLK